MSKGNSGLFSGTLGTSFINGSQDNTSYSERGIEIPGHIKQTLAKLKEKGDTVSGEKSSFPMKDVSIMSKETGVEFAKLIIGNRAYLIRGDKNGAAIPGFLLSKIAKSNGSLDFHTHPHDNDCIPSGDDLKTMKTLRALTGQLTSQIITPNGKTVTFNEWGVVETGTVSNIIDETLKKALLDLWG